MRGVQLWKGPGSAFERVVRAFATLGLGGKKEERQQEKSVCLSLWAFVEADVRESEGQSRRIVDDGEPHPSTLLMVTMWSGADMLCGT